MRLAPRTPWLALVGGALLLIACDSGDDTASGDGGDGAGDTAPVPSNDAAPGGASDDDGATAGAGGDTTPGGSATTPDDGASATEVGPLQDGVAGAACASDADCATGGTCLTEVELLGALAAFTDVGGEPAAAPGGSCTLPCTLDTDCGAGGTCVGEAASLGSISQGDCQLACTADSDCREGYRCAHGATAAGTDAEAEGVTDMPGCVPIPATATLEANVVGTPCAADADCAGGGVCQLEAEGTRFVSGSVYPGGSCSGACLQDSDCGEAGRCLMVEGEQGAGTCLLECASDADCREGYRCREQSPDLHACVPGDPPVVDGQAGIACTPEADGSSTECGSRCFEELGGSLGALGGGATPVPGGYCSTRCMDDADCGGGVCLGKIDLPVFANITGICYAACAEDGDCGRDGYNCRPYESRASSFFGGDETPPSVCQPIPAE